MDEGPDPSVVQVGDGGSGRIGERRHIAAAAALPRAWSTDRAPGITAVTPGWSMTQRSASWAGATPSGARAANSCAAATPVSKSTPENVSPASNASPCRLNVRWSSAAKVVSRV